MPDSTQSEKSGSIRLVDAARTCKAKALAQGRRLERLALFLLIGSLLYAQSSILAAQIPQAPTFQFKDAKTPAESIDSIKLLERALELTQTALGPDDTTVGELAYRLAQRYNDAGDYDMALRSYQRSLAIREKNLGPEHPSVGDCLNDLGCLQQDLENYDEALRLFKRSLVVTEKAYGPEHPEVAITLSSMAEVYCSKSEYAEALRVGERSLRIREKVLGKEHPDVADSLSGLAEIYRRMGKTEQALRTAQRSLAIAEKSLRPDHPLIAASLFTLAEVQKDRSSFDQALALYRRALAIDEKISGPDHPDVFRDLSSLAQLYAVMGDSRSSISSLVDLSTRQRRYLAHHFQTSSWIVASQVATVFRSSSEILQTLCATLASDKNINAAKLGAESCALSKALWEEVQAAHAALEADKQTKAGDLYSRYQSLQSQLTRLPESELDQTNRDAKRADLEREMRQILSELAQRIGLVAQRLLEQTPTLIDIARQLPAQSALIDIVQFRRYDFTAKSNQWHERHYAVYLTFPLSRDSTNITVERVDLGEAAPIDGAVQLVCQRMSSGAGYTRDDIPATLQRLGDLIYAPLARHLTNVSHLIISPDGQLNRLPFEMLRVRDRFLVEEKTTSYVTSGREIARLAESTKPKIQSPKYLSMGGPDFDLDLSKAANFQIVGAVALLGGDGGGGAAGSRANPSTGTPQLRSFSRDYHGIRFAALPGAEQEARQVAQLLGSDCALRLGAQAREAELKMVQSPQVLHLATHGFFLSDQDLVRTNSSPHSHSESRGGRWNASLPKDDWENPLLRCGIALAGANHAGEFTNAPAEDGLLTGLEASLLNLQGTELVILSACDSGTGEVAIGEGVMSLRRAFRIAGAQTVLASHWKVSDKTSTSLITTFVQRWRAAEPRAEAWRDAQLSLLRSKDFSSPYFWAAFTLTGQWK